MTIKIVEDFLRSGRVVCPFAKSNRHLIVEVDRAPIRSQREIRRTCQRYAHTRGKKPPRALVLVGPDLGTGFDATKEWAHASYLELATALRIVSGAESSAARLYGERMLASLLDDASRTREFLSCGPSPIHCFCMAPVYPPPHPRFARAPMVVVQWVADVDGVPVTERLAIRKAAQAGAGRAYDADAYLLPLDLPPLDPRLSEAVRLMLPQRRNRPATAAQTQKMSPTSAPRRT